MGGTEALVGAQQSRFRVLRREPSMMRKNPLMPYKQEKFHDCGDFIRLPAPTDSCDTSEGDPEGSPFTFTDAFY
jgi:hypothetical protein